MMRYVVALLLLVAAHFALSIWNPGPRATIIWPWGDNSRVLVPAVGGLPKQGGTLIVPLLGTVSAIAFVAAILSLLGWIVPALWFPALVVVGSALSLVLFALFFSPIAIIPMALDLLLIAGVFMLDWGPNMASNG